MWSFMQSKVCFYIILPNKMLKVKENVLEEVVKQLIKEGGLFVQSYETSPFE